MSNAEKFKSWLERLINGERGYEGIRCKEEKLLYQVEGYTENVTEFSAFIWKDKQKVFEKIWKQEDREESTLPYFVLKNHTKMLFYDGKGRVYNFGFKKKESQEVRKFILIYYKVEDMGALIVASSEVPEIRQLSYIQEYKEADAMQEFLALIKMKMFTNGKEVIGNERESEY